jgi:hypothetical protein
MALVAATTLGLGHFEHLRAEISTESGASPQDDGISGGYRLIVQAYSPDALDGDLPGARAKPLSSVQRAVTAEELRRGLSVDLVQLGAAKHRPAVVIAWVEPGQPDLEFDGLTARPHADAVYGLARIENDTDDAAARVVLRRAVA